MCGISLLYIKIYRHYLACLQWMGCVTLFQIAIKLKGTTNQIVIISNETVIY